jgi:hypothetical protein
LYSQRLTGYLGESEIEILERLDDNDEEFEVHEAALFSDEEVSIDEEDRDDW